MSLGASRPELAGIGGLRSHTARGTLINAGFQVGLSALGLGQRLIAAAFLTAADFGLWAVVLTILVNLGWLKNLGVMDKYLQQSEPDQELAFQKAFTVELVSAIALLALIALVLPIWAAAYGHDEIVLAGLLTALSYPMNVLQAPSWIPYRRLDYQRQRLLTSIAPVVGFVVTVILAVAGAGYWCFVAGVLAGSVCGGAVCLATCPYRVRLRWDPTTLRQYASFSWPLVASGLTGLALVQTTLLILNHIVGLRGVGAVGIVIGIVTFADRVDAIVSQTIYPAVCAVATRVDLLREIFVKSNRLALIWAIPVAVGMALFASDLITFVLGEKWRLAEPLFVIVGLSVGLGQVAFNWVIFFRATAQTRPIFLVTFVNAVVFLVVLVATVPAIGLEGYGAAFAASTATQISLRSFFIGRLIGGFSGVSQALRAVLPVLPAVAVVLALRLTQSADRTLLRAVLELMSYGVVAAVSTLVLERALIREIGGYLRRGPVSAAGGPPTG